MAGDWIKMRVWLSRDPRVISMADFLACERAVMDWLTDPVRQSCKDSAYSHVTRHVMVALCVTGLLVTWGTAREQGDRIGDDLVMRHCDFSILDGMTDIPCFGEALAFVGWARETDDGSVVFPKFFKDNESPDDRHRRQAAERQANKRLRDAEKTSPKSNDESNVISHVTVTHREEKRREEKKDQKKEAPADADLFPNVPEQVVKDFKAIRRVKKAAITPTAMAGIVREAEKAGMTLAAALAVCCERGWAGFKAEWVTRDAGSGQPTSAGTPRKRRMLS